MAINLSNFSLHLISDVVMIFLLLVRFCRRDIENVLISQLLVQIMLINLFGNISEWYVFYPFMMLGNVL